MGRGNCSKPKTGETVRNRGHFLWELLWYDPAGSLGRCLVHAFLAPLEALYRVVLRRDQARRLRRRQALPRCVISVGNITVGGTGKTPTVLWIARALHEAGRTVAVLSRGYGRRGSGVEKVRLQGPIHEAAARYGDEPVLIARRLARASVWVGAGRWEAGGRAVAEDRPDVLLLDDGFQHLQLHRDLDLVLLDAARPFGNGRLLPAGPLREPPDHLARAHAVILVGEARACPPPGFERLKDKVLRGKPVFHARPVIRGFFRADPTGLSEPLGNLFQAPCIAAAGIARPDRFFSALETLGIPCVRRLAFPDHHRWTPEDERALLDTLRSVGARWIVTTEKDAVRMPPSVAARAVYAAMDLDFGPDPDGFREFILHAVRSWGGG